MEMQHSQTISVLLLFTLLGIFITRSKKQITSLLYYNIIHSQAKGMAINAMFIWIHFPKGGHFSVQPIRLNGENLSKFPITLYGHVVVNLLYSDQSSGVAPIQSVAAAVNCLWEDYQGKFF